MNLLSEDEWRRLALMVAALRKDIDSEPFAHQAELDAAVAEWRRTDA